MSAVTNPKAYPTPNKTTSILIFLLHPLSHSSQIILSSITTIPSLSLSLSPHAEHIQAPKNGAQVPRRRHRRRHRGSRSRTRGRRETSWEDRRGRPQLRSCHSGHVAGDLDSRSLAGPPLRPPPDDVLRLLHWLRTRPARLDSRPVRPLSLSLSLSLSLEIDNSLLSFFFFNPILGFSWIALERLFVSTEKSSLSFILFYFFIFYFFYGSTEWHDSINVS